MSLRTATSLLWLISFVLKGHLRRTRIFPSINVTDAVNNLKFELNELLPPFAHLTLTKDCKRNIFLNARFQEFDRCVNDCPNKTVHHYVGISISLHPWSFNRLSWVLLHNHFFLHEFSIDFNTSYSITNSALLPKLIQYVFHICCTPANDTRR